MCLRKVVFKHRTAKQFKSSLTGFDSAPYERIKKSRGGRVIKKNLSYNIRKDLSESDKHKEILSVEISYKNSSNILLRCCYKPPKGDNDVLSMFLKQVFRFLGLFRHHANIQKNYLQHSYRITKNN